MTAQQIHDTYRAQLDRIEGNRTYSDHAKRVMSAKAYTAAAAQLAQQRQAELDSLNQQRGRLQKRMFGANTDADPSAVIARRDAADRAAKLDDTRQAQDALTRAERDGDTVLCQAIAAHAAEQQWTPVLDAYAATRPGFADNAREYNELPGTGDQLWETRHAAQFIPAMPASLANVPSYQIGQLAEQDMEAA